MPTGKITPEEARGVRLGIGTPVKANPHFIPVSRDRIRMLAEEHQGAEVGRGMTQNLQGRFLGGASDFVGQVAYSQGLNNTSIIQRLTGQDRGADQSQSLRSGINVAASEGEGMIRAAGRNVAETVPNMLVAAATGGVPGVIAYAGASEANEAITTGRRAGLSGVKLGAYAGAKGAEEMFWTALFQRIPGLSGTEKYMARGAAAAAGKGLKDATRMTAGQAIKDVLFKDLPGEFIEENITELGHNVIDSLFGVEKWDWKNVWPTIRQTSLATFMQTMLIGGAGKVDQRNRANYVAGIRDLVNTDEGAMALARTRPDIVADITGRGPKAAPPSRKDYERWGLPQAPQAERAALQQRLSDLPGLDVRVKEQHAKKAEAEQAKLDKANEVKFKQLDKFQATINAERAKPVPGDGLTKALKGFSRIIEVDPSLYCAWQDRNAAKQKPPTPPPPPAGPPPAGPPPTGPPPAGPPPVGPPPAGPPPVTPPVTPPVRCRRLSLKRRRMKRTSSAPEAMSNGTRLARIGSRLHVASPGSPMTGSMFS